MPFVFNPVTGKLDFVNPPTTDASLLTSGTLADARLSSNIPKLDGAANQLFQNEVDFGQSLGWQVGVFGSQATISGYNNDDTSPNYGTKWTLNENGNISCTGNVQCATLNEKTPAYLSTAQTFTAGQSITAAANTSALTASYSVTGANTTPLVSLTGTWNTTGVAQGILLNVTDTASAATSRLLELQTGGTSRFVVRKDGAISLGTDHVSPTGLSLSTGGLGNAIQTSVNGAGSFLVAASRVNLPAGSVLGWVSGTGLQNAADTILTRDAANTLAQRNGTNAQLFRIYNTYTDASNYERGFMRWNSNTLEIGTEAGGTGTATREVSLLAGGNTFLKLSPPASRIISSYGISPAADNAASLGISTIRWSNVFTKGIVQNGTIGATLTPASNGDLVIEQTSNTSITFKMKGTDGTVRTASLILT